MAIEKIKLKGNQTVYRSNVYYKGHRYIGSRRETKKEAEIDEINQKRDLLTGNYHEDSRKTLDQGFNDYMELLAPKNLSFKSQQITKSLYNKHLRSVFGFREMISIKPLELQKFLTKKESELSNSTIIKIYTLLNQVYKMMVSWGEIKNNPLDGVKKPQPSYKEKRTWTKEQCHAFLEVAVTYQSYIAFWLALQFGLRQGEVLGLEWKDVDLEGKVLHIVQAYHEEEKKLGRLKTKASYRSIPMSDQQVHLLKKYRKVHSDDKLVAASSTGGFMMKRNIRRAMEIICEKAKVPKITFHELRHTHATLLLEMGESPRLAQEKLGHTKVQTTLAIYSHIRPQVHQESAQRFSAFFEDD